MSGDESWLEHHRQIYIAGLERKKEELLAEIAEIDEALADAEKNKP